MASQPLDDNLDEALPLGERTAAREICLIDTRGEVRPYVAELLSHEGMLAHIARSRQFLPFGYNLLTQYELANLLFGVTDEFLLCRERIRNAPAQEQIQNRRRLEGLLALHLMLWFGRTLEDCKKLRIAERNARPSSVLELVLADETGPAEFRFLHRRQTMQRKSSCLEMPFEHLSQQSRYRTWLGRLRLLWQSGTCRR